MDTQTNRPSPSLWNQDGVNIDPQQDELLSENRLHQMIFLFVGLGLAARVLRYVLRFPLWEDECFLCVNLIDRNYWELTQTLDYEQVAPVLFLWTQLTLVKWFGFSEMVLRLVSFGSAIGSLLLFVHVARRLLKGTACVIAIALFSVSYFTIRYAAEAKPYGSDLLISMALIAMTVEWLQRPQKTVWLWGLAAFLPFALGFSYPAVFIAGGVSLAVGSVLVRQSSLQEHSWQGWIAWVSYNLSLLGSFGVVLALAPKKLDYMEHFWVHAFPPLHDPLQFPLWMLKTHTSLLLPYPVGGANGASTLTAIWCIVGLIVLLRQKKAAWLILFLTPFLLNFIAGCLHKYPYAAELRTSFYLAPIICLVAGLGLASSLQFIAKRWNRSSTPLVYGTLGLFLLVLVATVGRDACFPRKSLKDELARAFARAFWHCGNLDGEVACIKTDLGENFAPRAYQKLSPVALFDCNREIYSPRHYDDQPLSLENISQDHPLRCVQYIPSDHPFDANAYEGWIAQMQQQYHLASRDRYISPFYDKRDKIIQIDHIEILKFVPHVAPSSLPMATKRPKTKNR